MTHKKRRRGRNSFKPAKLTQNLTRTLLQYVGGRRYTPMTEENLSTQLGIAEMHRTLLHQILSDLVEAGTLSNQRGKFALSSAQKKLATGTISIHHKGFGFVKTTEGPHIFIPKHLTREAIDGDTVEVEIASVVSTKGPEGAVIAILKRSRTHLAGIVIEKTGPYFTAYSPLLGKDKPILIKAKTGALKEGDRIICKILSWQNESDLTSAEMTSLIGHISDPSIDVEAAIQEFGLPDKFSAEAIEEARKYGKRISKNDMENRLDLTGAEAVTIDPDTARDYDDAISLTCDERGHFHLGVHIADVAHYVKPKTHLDKEAYERCNSTYFPGRCVPMLPEELSNELCSLKEGVKRLTLSVLAEIDPSGNLVDYTIARTVIKSQKRFTYKEAFEVIQGKRKSAHAPVLERMTRLCHLLKQKRFERGSIDFAMPDDVIIVDSKGVPQRIERVEYDITHQMIEEFMLKANELTAIHLAKQKKILIYRVHEEPSAESFQDFYAFARSLGFTLPSQPTHIDIQALFQDAKNSPLLPQLSVAFIRSMRLAQYSSDNIGHYGLALEQYCHFTSPIRRYTDLIIQRLLVGELPKEVDLDRIATACSEKERLSFKAESSVIILKKLRLAQARFAEDPTRIYEAVITKIKAFALFFEVAAFDLESSLHVSEIGHDFFEFNPTRLSLRGNRTGKTFIAGQQIHVRLDRIDLPLQETKWSFAESSPSYGRGLRE